MASRALEIVRRARKKLSRREYPVVPMHIGRLDYAGAELLVGVTSRAEILSRLRPCAKEPWTVQWLERTLRDGDVLYDVGANIGAYSLIAASLGRASRVIAVEPSYSTFASLCDNVRLNGQEGAVVPLPFMLSDRTGLVDLGYRDLDAGAAEHALRPDEGAVYRQPTPAYRLDDLVAQLGVPPPTVVKIDVDGAEAAVLAGGAGVLARPELRSVLVEIARDGGAAVTEALERAGLRLAERVDDREGVPLAHVWYGIFERP